MPAFSSSVFACCDSRDPSSLWCSGIIGPLSSMSLPLPLSCWFPDGTLCSGLSSLVGVTYNDDCSGLVPACRLSQLCNILIIVCNDAWFKLFACSAEAVMATVISCDICCLRSLSPFVSSSRLVVASSLRSLDNDCISSRMSVVLSLDVIILVAYSHLSFE